MGLLEVDKILQSKDLTIDSLINLSPLYKYKERNVYIACSSNLIRREYTCTMQIGNRGKNFN